jgi:hypothetical protein
MWTGLQFRNRDWDPLEYETGVLVTNPRRLVKSGWNATEDVFWHVGVDATILLTFNFNLEGYCTSSWHGIVSEHTGNVGTPGIAGDTRYASGPPGGGVIIASCRVRMLALVGTEQ